MLQFGGQFNTLKVPEQRITRTLDRVLSQVIREAARKWLRTMITHVPVETGMARGALQPLGRLLRVAVPIRPRRKPYFSKLEGTVSEPSAGADKSEFEIIDDRNRLTDMLYSFTWTTNVLHYYLRQFYNGSALAGEDAIREAEKAFFDHIESTIDRRIADALVPFIEVQN